MMYNGWNGEDREDNEINEVNGENEMVWSDREDLLSIDASPLSYYTVQ